MEEAVGTVPASRCSGLDVQRIHRASSFSAVAPPERRSLAPRTMPGSVFAGPRTAKGRALPVAISAPASRRDDRAQSGHQPNVGAGAATGLQTHLKSRESRLLSHRSWRQRPGALNQPSSTRRSLPGSSKRSRHGTLAERAALARGCGSPRPAGCVRPASAIQWSGCWRPVAAPAPTCGWSRDCARRSRRDRPEPLIATRPKPAPSTVLEDREILEPASSARRRNAVPAAHRGKLLAAMIR